jgi:Tol biopolymer transport system component
MRKKLITSPRGTKCPQAIANVIFFSTILCLCFLLVSCTKENARHDLGSFERISDLSISPDGNQILFNGCGHKDHPACTIYRFERSTSKLYRYIAPSGLTMMRDGRYASTSSKFAFLIVPLNEERKLQLNDIQIAYVNEDGTGFHQVTHSDGTKVAPMLSYDEKTLVYFRGKERKSGRTAVSNFDLYKTDLLTGKETQLTNLSFYGVSDPYFTPDDKNVIFDGDSPLRPLRGVDAIEFQGEYKKKYGDNIILQYPLDGSGVRQEPVPIIRFRTGSRWSMVTKDGSIWFEGLTGEMHYVGHYRCFPNGKTAQFTDTQLDMGQERYRLKMAVTPDGCWLAILYQNRNSRERSIGIFNTVTSTLYNIAIPAYAEDIKIQ